VSGGGRHPAPARDKQHLRLSRQIIIVGPPEFSGALVRNAAFDTVSFESLDELDRWRERRRESSDTIRQDVEAVLDDLCIAAETMPVRLRTMIEAISIEKHVPELRDLERSWSSRRSFYRMWHEAFDQPPSTFLRRVRSHHALRLLAGGCSKKEAALLAGYSSVDQMRRNLAVTPAEGGRHR